MKGKVTVGAMVMGRLLTLAGKGKGIRLGHFKSGTL